MGAIYNVMLRFDCDLPSIRVAYEGRSYKVISPSDGKSRPKPPGFNVVLVPEREWDFFSNCVKQACQELEATRDILAEAPPQVDGEIASLDFAVDPQELNTAMYECLFELSALKLFSELALDVQVTIV